MTLRVNGGIINNQTLTGSLRYFKMVGMSGVNATFAWTVSNGTVNLPVYVDGGPTGTARSYFVVGKDLPVPGTGLTGAVIYTGLTPMTLPAVPGSAAERALMEISKQADIVTIAVIGDYSSASEIHFACSATSFGWGSDTPNYTTNPGPEDLTAAASQMQTSVRALGSITVYESVGATPNSTTQPSTRTVDMGQVTITEVPFRLA